MHAIDFSAVRTPGRYQICVDTIGCSTSVTIAATSTWRRAAVTVARSMFQQRSGIALTEPFTAVTHPAAFTAAGGTAFHQTDLTMVDDPSNVGVDDRFDEYGEHVVGEVAVDASGGHFDAGDWNSRIQHLAYLDAALDLVRLYPSTFADLDLDIPESGNAIPDLIDEGLWDLDQFMRLQTADGGIPGNVDQGRFGNGDETSWDNEIDVYVFAPDVWSTYIYASAAAQAATVLRDDDATRAAGYAASAGKAMAWAEAQWAAAPAATRTSLDGDVEPQRAAAAAAMLQLTGDRSWNDVFADASTFDTAAADSLDCPGPTCDAAWLYAMADQSLTDPTMRSNSIASIRNNADKVLAGQQTTAFGWAVDYPGAPFVYGLGPSIPHGVGLLRAFVLTGDERYRTAAVQSASFSLGGNPLNTSFATGLGTNPTRHPLIVDAQHGALPVWPGTFVYGIDDLGLSADDDWVDTSFLKPAGLTPPANAVPLLWSWYDVGPFPMMNEFTVQQSHAVALWTLGVLAATT
ncbi:MAG: glycoside hydrolase family 9 protein [Ilumatobacteraceae bacterium]